MIFYPRRTVAMVAPTITKREDLRKKGQWISSALLLSFETEAIAAENTSWTRGCAFGKKPTPAGRAQGSVDDKIIKK
jgi:hypothetical protein